MTNAPEIEIVEKECYFQRKIFDSGDGYIIASYADLKGKPFVAVGSFLPQIDDVKYILRGKVIVHKKYGRQLEVMSFDEELPTTKRQIEMYLTKVKYKHFGKVTIKKALSLYGEDIFDVIENEPEKIKKLFSGKKGEEFLEDYNAKKSIKMLFPLLEEFALPISRALKVHEIFSKTENYIDMLRENPYFLCLVKGISFNHIDKQMKLRKDFKPAKRDRIIFALNYIMQEFSSAGDLFVNKEDLIERLGTFLNTDVKIETFVHIDVIKLFIEEQIQKKNLIEYGEGFLYTRKAFEAEDDAAKGLVELINDSSNPDFSDKEIEKAIKKAEKEGKITLDDTQKSAVITALKNPVSIITGGPGCGKTTTLKILVGAFKELKANADIALCAPTGKAARRMSESVGLPATTIHKLLGLRGDESAEDIIPVDYNLVIMDESSMTDMFLFNIFINAVEYGTKLVFVGDKDQLPSVGAGLVFEEMINSKEIPTTTLGVIHRQADGNAIIGNSKKIIEGKNDLVFNDDFMFYRCNSDKEVQNVIKVLLEQLDGDAQILTPYKTKTAAGTKELNVFLQELLNPKGEELKACKKNWRVGDKVINLVNSEEISNGDTGIITEIEKDEGIWVNFDCGAEVFFEKPEIENLDLAYALTVHKSQGSEYKTVIIPFIKDFWKMRQRKLLYTAVTRAKEKVIIVGDDESLFYAIAGTATPRKRNTLFAKRIKEYNSKN